MGGLLCVCILAAWNLDALAHSVPFPIFLAGVMAAGWYGGLWPALALTVLSTLTLDVVFIHPVHSVAISSPGEGVLLGVFGVVGVLISTAAGALHDARRHAEQLLRLNEALARAATPTDIAEVAQAQALTLLGASHTALWVIPGEEGTETARHVPVPNAGLPPPEVLTALAQEALRTGALVWPRRGASRGICLPLRNPSRMLGALAMLLPERASGPRQFQLAQILGDACATALERALLHERLQREQRLLDSVLGQAPVGVIVAEAPSSRILLYNAASERILGHPVIPSADVSHYARYGGYHADGSPVAAEEYPTARALLKGEQVRGEVMRYRRGDGQNSLLEISAAPVRTPDGAITAAVCVFADVTERQNAEQRLRASEERYRQLFEAAPQVIWTNQTDGGNSQFNSLWFKLTGQTQEQASHYGWLNAIHPEDRARLKAQREEAIRQEQAYAIDFRLRMADGGYRWQVGRVVPLYDAGGKLEGWLGAAIDVHERRRSESVQRFLAEASATLSRSLDERETIEQATRLMVPELADWSIVDLASPDGLERAAVFHPDPNAAPAVEIIRRHRPRPESPSPVLEVFRTGEVKLVERFGDEDYRATVSSEDHLSAVRALAPHSLLVVPLVARERLLGVITLLRGGTRERFTEEEQVLARNFSQRCALAIDNARLLTELKRSLRTRDDFLSSVSHDLRNPLSVITMRAASLRAELAQRGSIAPERLTTATTRILWAAEEMNSMVESLLDLVRSEMGERPNLRRTEVDVGELARGVIVDQQQAAQRHTFQLHTPETPVMASLDEIRVRRVVRNLLLNAVKYSPEGSNIEVLVQQCEAEGRGWAVIEVRDRGIGIPAGDLPHLFERFHRGENVVGRIPGTGLGLFGARQLVEQHGGRITVTSVEGQGSSFRVWLPQRQ
ncbi:PAS domain S-box protein [Corallococcus macrosporus]|uniref:histidine kinase n=1 Tax=Corallococcus macrosporus TaxID=35 RepID=A0ABS3D9X3_9BACT|nr:PAS domain S-box protein [Corallococcus macrosporus]